MPSKTKKINIIVADDDPDDRFLFKAALENLHIEFNIVNINTGVELMKWLLTESVVLPDILFLDLNMPLKRGVECLTEIKSNPVLQNIVVAIYSTSSNPADVKLTYERGANLFLNKPNTFNELTELMRVIFEGELKPGLQRPTIQEYLAFSALPKDIVFKLYESL